MKSLIVYYSLTNGNTKRIAEMLQQATQADIAEIQTVTPYTGGYDAVVAQGQEEVNRGYEPEIQPLSVSGTYDCRYENRLSRCCICTRKRNSV